MTSKPLKLSPVGVDIQASEQEMVGRRGVGPALLGRAGSAYFLCWPQGPDRLLTFGIVAGTAPW